MISAHTSLAHLLEDWFACAAKILFRLLVDQACTDFECLVKCLPSVMKPMLSEDENL
jgi:hypothetical protein